MAIAGGELFAGGRGVGEVKTIKKMSSLFHVVPPHWVMPLGAGPSALMDNPALTNTHYLQSKRC